MTGCGAKPFAEHLPELFAKLNAHLKSSEVAAQTAKVEAAEVHKMLALLLQTAADVVVQHYWEPSREALQSTMRDKAPRVQKAASEALSEWEKLKEMCEKDRKKESSKEVKGVSGVWGSAARAAKFLKKNVGSGGGNTSKSAFRNARSSHSEVRDKFYSIMKQAMDKRKEETINLTPSKEAETVIEEKVIKKFEPAKNMENKGLPGERKLEELKIISPAKQQAQTMSTIPAVNIPPSELAASKAKLVDTAVMTQDRMHVGPDQTEAKEFPADDTITYEELPSANAKWVEIAQQFNTGNTEESYKTVLSSRDDLYLLRLMMQTGPVTGSFSADTSEAVLKRSSQITKSNAIAGMLLKLTTRSIANGQFLDFSRETQNELLDTLHALGRLESEVGEVARKTYEDGILRIRQLS